MIDPRQFGTEEEILAKIERLDLIYSCLPGIQCQGHCYECCGPAHMTPFEMYLLTRGQPPVPEPTSLVCPLLKGNRCTRHELRPLICRSWGAFEGMLCKYGCVPEWIGTREEFALAQKMVDELFDTTLEDQVCFFGLSVPEMMEIYQRGENLRKVFGAIQRKRQR